MPANNSSWKLWSILHNFHEELLAVRSTYGLPTLYSNSHPEANHKAPGCHPLPGSAAELLVDRILLSVSCFFLLVSDEGEVFD